jgi:hypothetical protein
VYWADVYVLFCKGMSLLVSCTIVHLGFRARGKQSSLQSLEYTST